MSSILLLRPFESDDERHRDATLKQASLLTTQHLAEDELHANLTAEQRDADAMWAEVKRRAVPPSGFSTPFLSPSPGAMERGQG
jgi:hypothetical protein